jgi:hypothetical protein
MAFQMVSQMVLPTMPSMELQKCVPMEIAMALPMALSMGLPMGRLTGRPMALQMSQGPVLVRAEALGHQVVGHHAVASACPCRLNREKEWKTNWEKDWECQPSILQRKTSRCIHTR